MYWLGGLSDCLCARWMQTVSHICGGGTFLPHGVAATSHGVVPIFTSHWVSAAPWPKKLLLGRFTHCFGTQLPVGVGTEAGVILCVQVGNVTKGLSWKEAMVLGLSPKCLQGERLLHPLWPCLQLPGLQWWQRVTGTQGVAPCILHHRAEPGASSQGPALRGKLSEAS